MSPARPTGNRYRVAIAGCHRMLDRKLVGHNWAAAFAAVSRVDLVGVFDKGAETRRAFVDCWGPLPAFDDFGRMLRELAPDIVCIATRQTMHADQIEEATATGINGILCEKPLATSPSEVDRIVAACERHQVSFSFGLDRRWYPYYRRLAQLLRNGIIGEVRAVFAFGAPNLINHGCHWFDRVLDLAGDPEVSWVAGAVDPLIGESEESRRRLDPPGSGQIQLANGVEAFVSPAGSSLGFDIVGSNGRLVVAGDGSETRLWHADGGAPLAVNLPAAPGPPATPLAVEDLISAMEGGRSTLSDVHCARRASEIGFAIHQSNREGGRRIAPAEIDRTLRIESFPWGNE